jgi:hypothetical protein
MLSLNDTRKLTINTSFWPSKIRPWAALARDSIYSVSTLLGQLTSLECKFGREACGLPYLLA